MTLYEEQEAEIRALEQERQRLAVHLARALRALEQYADPAHWAPRRFHWERDVLCDTWEGGGHGYELARAALAELA